MELNGADEPILYLARVLVNQKPVIHKINAHEYKVNDFGHLRPCIKVKRAKWSWLVNSFGWRGAAAISDTPSAALGAATVLLEAKVKNKNGSAGTR